MSLETPGAEVCLLSSCYNQLEAGNTAFREKGSSGICGLFLSGKQQAETVVFSFNTALITTDMWQTYVQPFFNDLSACSESAVLAQHTRWPETKQ